MIQLVSWNINRQTAPWHCLVKMAEQGDADVALLQETGSPPDDLVEPLRYEKPPLTFANGWWTTGSGETEAGWEGTGVWGMNH